VQVEFSMSAGQQIKDAFLMGPTQIPSAGQNSRLQKQEFTVLAFQTKKSTNGQGQFLRGQPTPCKSRVGFPHSPLL